MKTILFPLLVLAPTLALLVPLRTGPPVEGAPREAHPSHEDQDSMPPKQKITTFLWFVDDAEEAVRFYVSLFSDSKILSELRWGPDGPSGEAKLMTARFQLAGQEFVALNGRTGNGFTEAISLAVDCQTQQEVDELWEKLTDGGEPGRCGWLKDRYGVSWQIIPGVLIEMLGDEDSARARRVGEAMLQMGKIDIQRLKEAYDGD